MNCVSYDPAIIQSNGRNQSKVCPFSENPNMCQQCLTKLFGLSALSFIIKNRPGLQHHRPSCYNCQSSTITDLLKDMAIQFSHWVINFPKISANPIEDPGAPPILHGQSPLLSATRCSPPVAHSQLTPLNIPTQPPLPPSCQSDKHANTLHPSVYPAILSPVSSRGHSQLIWAWSCLLQ